jgi:hypothetical protein
MYSSAVVLGLSGSLPLSEPALDAITKSLFALRLLMLDRGEVRVTARLPHHGLLHLTHYGQLILTDLSPQVRLSVDPGSVSHRYDGK